MRDVKKSWKMTKSCIKEKTVCLKPTQCKLTIRQYSIVFKERERKHKSPHNPTTQRQPRFGVLYYYFMCMHTHIYTHFKQKSDPMPFVCIHFNYKSNKITLLKNQEKRRNYP